MRTGRRPNGLCGAAILISAKIHNLERSTSQIVNAVRVGEETLRKRVNEFKTTNTAMLTRGKLLQIEAEHSNPFEFKVEEKPFEVPSVCKRQILKQLLPESQNGEGDLGKVRGVMMKKAPKIQEKILKVMKSEEGEMCEGSSDGESCEKDTEKWQCQVEKFND